MPYCDLAYLLNFIEADDLVSLCTLEDEKTISSTEVTTVVAAQITAAESTVNHYLLERYSDLKTRSPVPPEVMIYTAIITIYTLFARRNTVSEQWANLYNDTIQALKDLGIGIGTLGDGDSAGGALLEVVKSFLHDAGFHLDSDLSSNDHRRYTFSKQRKLFGV